MLSISLADNSNVRDVSSSIFWFEIASNIGASLTGLITTLKLVLTLNLLTTSLAVTVISPFPNASETKDNVRAPSDIEADSWSIASLTEYVKSEPFSTSEKTETKSITTSSLSSSTSKSSIGDTTTGTSFTAFTVNVNVALSDKSPSLTVTVTSSAPL